MSIGSVSSRGTAGIWGGFPTQSPRAVVKAALNKLARLPAADASQQKRVNDYVASQPNEVFLVHTGKLGRAVDGVAVPLSGVKASTVYAREKVLRIGEWFTGPWKNLGPVSTGGAQGPGCVVPPSQLDSPNARNASVTGVRLVGGFGAAKSTLEVDYTTSSSADRLIHEINQSPGRINVRVAEYSAPNAIGLSVMGFETAHITLPQAAGGTQVGVTNRDGKSLFEGKLMGEPV